MKKIGVGELTENFIETIGKEWMLITAGKPGHFNTMTASWGGVGYLWNRPVVFVFVRPERYTFGFMEENETFTLSFLGEEHKRIHKVCGSKSGRDTDKIAQTGLLPEQTPSGNVVFGQSRLSIECRKLYGATLQEAHYADPGVYDKWYGAHGGDHKMYIAEIVGVWVRE